MSKYLTPEGLEAIIKLHAMASAKFYFYEKRDSIKAQFWIGKARGLAEFIQMSGHQPSQLEVEKAKVDLENLEAQMKTQEEKRGEAQADTH